MSREEAIRCLSVHSSTNGSELCTDKQHYEAKQMAIKALEQEPCKDAISRQAVLEMAYDMSEIDGEHFTEPCMVVDVEDIQKLPPVTPQQKIGRWIKQTLSVKPFGEDTVLCNQCAFMTDKDNSYNYCPNCGAKMQAERENNE